MTIAQLIPLVSQLSIALIVFSIALAARPGDLTYLLRKPSLLVRSLLSMSVLIPILAAIIARSFHLRPEVKIALIVLAVSPVPPILPGKQSKAGGNVSYAIGLLMTTAVLAIVTVPVSIALIGHFFERDVQVPMPVIAMILAKSVIVPVFLGVIVSRVAPSFAQRAAKPISTVGTILLMLAFLPVVIKMWPAIAATVGDFTLVSIVLFVFASLLIGHLLGGPDPDDRTVLGLASASRHPAVALATASAITAPENQPAVSAAVMLAVLVSIVVTGPYVKWRRRGHAAVGTPASTPAR
jgi:BASS family bile acid:Na+ symporter